MLSALHAEFQKAHRRHDLAICLVVPVVVFLWTGRLTSNDPEELANAYSALLYAQAQLIEGLPVDDPTAYAEAVCSLMK